MVIVKYKPAIFFDRDGVLNKAYVKKGKPYAPRDYSKFIVFDEVPELLKKLKNRGYLIVVVTNQPDIGNGFTKIQEVEKMHKKLFETRLIDKIYMCTHRQDENCNCRKPKTGMFMKAKEELLIDMNSSWMIGDRDSDIRAGYSAGVNCIFIDKGYKETKIDLIKCPIVKDLKSCVKKILT